jgi:pyrimidine operon attenuation protein/uracil phosphoribosyltransferase
MKAPRGYRERLVLMDRERLARTLKRMATEIVERHPDQKSTVLVGVRSRGVPMALRLARLITEVARVAPPVGALDITLYRDDLTMAGAQPELKGTEIPVSIDGRTVILVDDVLFTGRSVRGALDELIDFGRPALIELAVLVDRGHRELPIHADYVGRVVTTARNDIVQVMLKEQDGEDGVVLFEKEVPRRVVATKAKVAAKKKPAARRARPVKSVKPKARSKARSAGRRRK